jgi:hypothetical protein
MMERMPASPRRPSHCPWSTWTGRTSTSASSPCARALARLKPPAGRPREPTPLAPLVRLPFARHPHFNGREELLRRLGGTAAGEAAAITNQSQALAGLGGVGKTQLALEHGYASLEARRVALVWWVRAEEPALFRRRPGPACRGPWPGRRPDGACRSGRRGASLVGAARARPGWRRREGPRAPAPGS